MKLLNEIINKYGNYLFLILGAIIGFLFPYLYQRIFSKNKYSVAYNIGVIGYPQSGKTTFITSLFAHLFSLKILGNNYRLLLRGKETIEKVNDDLERLTIGKSLGPTTDQDLFSYRIDLTKRKFPFDENYKIQIGDFPGEDSEEFYDKYNDWLHSTPYFKWVMDADVFIFVIDVARVLSDTDNSLYKNKITKAIRAAWQKLEEYHFEGRSKLSNKPVILLFTKADLLLHYDKFQYRYNTPTIQKKVFELGFGDELPAIIKLNEDIEKFTNNIKGEYKEIIDFLQTRNKNTKVIFFSHFVTVDEQRLGMEEIVTSILPE
ncbi:MAG: GTPase domain-containing protein [Ignavibacteria bacterium]|jgi:GTPase SAR1 family protein